MSYSPDRSGDEGGLQSSGHEFREEDDYFDEQFEARLRELPIPYGEIGGPGHGIGKSLDHLLDSDVRTSEELPDSDVGGVAGRTLVLGLGANCSRVHVRTRQAAVARVPDPGPSLCTKDSLADVIDSCCLDERVRGRVPKPHERPWTPPRGRVCVYEHFFTDCRLWFPLPKFLTDYCARRKIAFSQLTVSSVRNAVGLAILAAKDGVEIDVDLFEKLTVFSRGRDNNGLCIASSTPQFRIVDGFETKIRNWRRYYFFVKVDEFSFEDSVATYIVDWNFSAGSSWLGKESSCRFFLVSNSLSLFFFIAVFPTKSALASYPPDFRAKLKKIRKNKTLWWPNVLEHSWICSPSCLRMGGADCDDIPSYAAVFAADDALPTDDAGRLDSANVGLESEPIGRIAEDVDDAVRSEETRRVRLAELEVARAGKRVVDRQTGSAPSARVGSKRSSRWSPRNRSSGIVTSGGPSRRGGRSACGDFAVPEDHAQGSFEGVDHSFSFDYAEKDVMFSGNRLACGDLASRVRGDFDDFPATDSLLGVNYYRDLASKQFQTMSSANRLVSFYEGRYREAAKEALENKAAAKEALENKAAAEKASMRVQIIERSQRQEKFRADELQTRLTRAEEMLASERKRLRDSRASAIRAEQKKALDQVREFRGRIDRLSRHILSLKARDVPRLLLSQVKGTKECIEAIIADGSEPSSKIPKLRRDLASYEEKLAGLSVFQLSEGDLETFPEFEVAAADGAVAHVPGG